MNNKEQINEDLDALLDVEDGLDEYELKFVTDMEQRRNKNANNWHYVLTPKQTTYLRELADKKG